MKLKFQPFDYQRVGIDKATKAKYSINAFEMGLGKTFVALALAAEQDISVTLIVCPAFLIPNWISEIEKFLGEKCSKGYKEGYRFCAISYTSMQRVKPFFSKFDYIVCDEVHYAKNLKAQRTKALHSLLKKHKPTYFLGLSGTPIKNRVPEFYSLLKLVSYGGKYPQFEKFRTPWIFNKTFCNPVTQFIYGRKVVTWEGIKNIVQLKELIAPIYNRLRAKNVLNLPDEIEQNILMADKPRTDSLLLKAFESYKGKKDTGMISSTKAISALAKVSYTVKFVIDRMPEAKKFIVFSDHIQSATLLHIELGKHFTARLITGGVNADKRFKYVEALNKGKIEILVATVGSLSVGVNLTGVNHMLFNDYPWVNADIAQAKKRIHRIGQSKTCYYYFILASKIDRMILGTLRKKQKVINALEVDHEDKVKR